MLTINFSKGMIQKYINDLYKSVLLLQSDEIPVVVKYVFDLFDDIARQNNVSILLVKCF